MTFTIQCPHCSNYLGEVFIMLKLSKIGLNINNNHSIKDNKKFFKENFYEPLGEVLDEFNLEKICCRGHIISYTEFEDS